MAMLPQVGRKLRTPKHPFYLEHMPFQIQPFLVAPVIPGETLKNATLQANVVTDPILNRLIGWWCEYYFFYVKHRDLTSRDDFTDMMLDMNWDNSSFLSSSASTTFNQYNGALRWTEYAVNRCVELYFREEGEAITAYQINGVNSAALNAESWLQSAETNDVYAVNDPTLTVGVDDVVTGSEVNELLQSWQFLRSQNMTNMSYQDWLATYGIKQPRVETHKPELLRYIREWQYPVSAIDPTDGSAATAVRWKIEDRLDKDRFFSEPGFIVGVTVARPKMYLKNLDGSAVGLLNNALAWMPAIMRDDPWTSLKKQDHDKGPLQTIFTDTDGYWVDLRDLFLHGEDYVNVARSGAGLNMATLPTAGLSNKYYPTDADVDGLFAGASDPVRQVRQDGQVRLSILTAIGDDVTPRGSLRQSDP